MIQPGNEVSGGSGDKRPSNRLPVNPRRHKVAPEQRKRVATACNNCNVRRVKCSGDRPCRQCTASSRECVYPVNVDKVTISRPELDDLRRKVETYERALQDAVPDVSRLQELLLQFAPSSPVSSTSPSSASLVATPVSAAGSASVEPEAVNLAAVTGGDGLAPGPVEGRLLRDAAGTARFFGATSSAAFLDHLKDFMSAVAPLAMAGHIDLNEEAEDSDDEDAENDNRSAVSSFLRTRGTYTTLDSRPLQTPEVNPLWLPPKPAFVAMLTELRHVIQDGNGEWPCGGIYWFGDLTTMPALPSVSGASPPTSADLDALRPLAFHQAALAVIAQTAKQTPAPGSVNSAEAFFARAHRLLGGNPLDTSHYRSMGEVAALMLMGLYLVQTNRREMAAAYLAAAVRAAVNLGAHRGWTDESGKRIFWTAYVLDRWISCLLGRPPSIADEVIQLPPPQDVAAMPPSAGLRAHIELARISGLINNASHRASSADEAARTLERITYMLNRWQTRLPPALQLGAGIAKDPASCLLHMQHNHLIILATRPVFFSAVRSTFAERLVTKSQPSIEAGPQLRHLLSCAGAAQRILQLARAAQHQHQQRQDRKSISPVHLHAGLQFVLDATTCLLLQELVTDENTIDAELPSRNGAVDFAMALFREEGGEFARDCAMTLHRLRVLVGLLRSPMEGSLLSGQNTSAALGAEALSGDVATSQMHMEMHIDEQAAYDGLVQWMDNQWALQDYPNTSKGDEDDD